MASSRGVVEIRFFIFFRVKKIHGSGLGALGGDIISMGESGILDHNKNALHIFSSVSCFFQFRGGL